MSSQNLPTKGELEILKALWKSGPSTAREVVNAISNNRKVAYTTVQTLLTIMVKKGFVECEKSKKAHRFSPMISKFQAQSIALKNMIDLLFDHSPGSLAQHIIGSKSLDELELDTLQKLIEDHRRTQK